MSASPSTQANYVSMQTKPPPSEKPSFPSVENASWSHAVCVYNTCVSTICSKLGSKFVHKNKYIITSLFLLFGPLRNLTSDISRASLLTSVCDVRCGYSAAPGKINYTIVPNLLINLFINFLTTLLHLVCLKIHKKVWEATLVGAPG